MSWALGGLRSSWEGWKVMSGSPAGFVYLRPPSWGKSSPSFLWGISLLPSHVVLVGLWNPAHAWLQRMAKKWAQAQARPIRIHPGILPTDFTYRGRRLFPCPLRLLNWIHWSLEISEAWHLLPCPTYPAPQRSQSAEGKDHTEAHRSMGERNADLVISFSMLPFPWSRLLLSTSQ